MNRTRLKLLSLLIFLCFGAASGSITICSWNLLDLGNSKNETEIAFIAMTLQTFDVIAIQEVVAGEGGTKAIVRLVERMNRNGTRWDYTISNPTISSTYKTECYAFIWNKTIVEKIGESWLDHDYEVEIDREPYFATFKKEGSIFTVVNFHAKTKSKQPETDIKYFRFFPALYPKLNLIFCGDFNCPQSHSVFNPLKSMGYKPAMIGQKTTLRMKCLRNDCLASEFDNLFYHPQKIRFIRSGVIHFYQSFPSMEKARNISDHVPIFLTFN